MGVHPSWPMVPYVHVPCTVMFTHYDGTLGIVNHWNQVGAGVGLPAALWPRGCHGVRPAGPVLCCHNLHCMVLWGPYIHCMVHYIYTVN